MNSLNTPNELLVLKDVFYLKVIEQLLKDFNLSGIELELDKASDPVRLWQCMSTRIDELIRDNPEKIRSLLYRVDLDENLVNKRVLENNADSLPQELSKLILLRLIQKVESRSRYV